jgi:hypothetical protein
MRRISLLVLATLACSDPTRPDSDPEPPAEVIVTAQVNVQLGDTPAGQEPGYIVTGEATATQGGVPVTASMDSVVIHYRIAAGPFIRYARRNAVPFSDDLPFTATAGQSYDIRAVMYATGTGTDATGADTDEWVASGIGIATGVLHPEP